MIEARFGLSVRVEGDATLVSPDYRLERFKTASRIIPTPESLNLPSVAYPDEEEIEEEFAEEEAEAGAGDKPAGKRKRRRRRRGGKSGQAQQPAPVEAAEPAEADAAPEEAPAVAEPAEGAAEEQPGRTRSRRRSRGRAADAAAEETPHAADKPAATSPFGDVIDLGDEAVSEIVEVPEADAPQRRRRERVRKPVTAVLADVVTAIVEGKVPEEAPSAEAARPPEVEAETPASGSEPGPAPEPEPVEPATEIEEAPQSAEKEEAPKRRGWWSRALGGS
jgi:ribonuclease E